MKDDSDDRTGIVLDLPLKPIDLRPKGDLPFQLIVNNTGRQCAHGARLIDANARAVECKDCKAPLDAFAVLLDVARDHERFGRALEHARTEVRAAELRLELLKRLEQNARSRLKRTGARVGSRSHYDWLIQYVRDNTTSPRKVDEAAVEGLLEFQGPVALLHAAAAAVERKAVGAAIELGRRALDELEAAFQVLTDEERKHA